MKETGCWADYQAGALFERDDGSRVAVCHWNGEKWLEAWEVYADGSRGEITEASPLYRYEQEEIDISELEENSDEWLHAFEIVDIILY